MTAVLAEKQPSGRKKLKVRTGCITCKIRKVKCDENKPACKRCLETGRRCDGYQAPEELIRTSKKRCLPPALPGQHLALLPGLPRLDVALGFGLLPSDEGYWLQYFSDHAGPNLASMTDLDFWRVMLPQLSWHFPPVRYALLALSTSYARVEAAWTGERNDSVVERKSSIQFYNQAIKSLHEHLNSDSDQLEIPLICCLLFICLELLYVDRDCMMDHLEHGLKILSDVQFRREDGQFTTALKHKLLQIFTRLDCQSTLYGKSVPTPLLHVDLDLFPKSREAFVDVAEAKSALDIMSFLYLNFIRNAHCERPPGDWPSTSQILLQAQLQEQSMIWHTRMDKLEKAAPGLSFEDMQTATILRVMCIAGFVYLCTCFGTSETVWDTYWAEFRSIIALAKPLFTDSALQSPSDTSSAYSSPASTSTSSTGQSSYTSVYSFSLDISILPPLYLVALKSRDPQLRRDALAMLESYSRREGMWDPVVHSQTARRLIEIEEGGMLRLRYGATETYMEPAPSTSMYTDNNAVLTEWPEEQVRVSDVEIHRVPEESSRVAKLIITLPAARVWEEELRVGHKTQSRGVP